MSTLMVPAYYDASTIAGASSINITGSATLVYGRRHLTANSVLLSDSTNDDANEAFFVNIPLTQNDIPEMAKMTLQESSVSTLAIDGGIADGVAAIALWFSLFFL